jgi:hypothetical protein
LDDEKELADKQEREKGHSRQEKSMCQGMGEYTHTHTHDCSMSRRNKLTIAGMRIRAKGRKQCDLQLDPKTSCKHT